ncbi:uncharacterized protein L201_002774 [Kwoniella dendrophila CBS 6074]|uniref:Zinc knuckle-domain-containing protein n=1 Tax=Kwoniella dendrophila CBS 6074 TaxID=1295534 RepID=A0AAX4JRX6_9TREE
MWRSGPRQLNNSDRAGPNTRCQKCLKLGHHTYQCTNSRPYVARPSRTKQLSQGKIGRDQPSIELPEEFKSQNNKIGLADKILKAKEDERRKEDLKKNKQLIDKKTSRRRSSSSSDSDSSSSSSSDSDSDSGSSSSSSSSSTSIRSRSPPRRSRRKRSPSTSSSRSQSRSASPPPRRKRYDSDSEGERDLERKPRRRSPSSSRSRSRSITRRTSSDRSASPRR